MSDDVIHYTTSIDKHRSLGTTRNDLPESAAVAAAHQHVESTIERAAIDWPITVRLFERPSDVTPKYVYAVHQSLTPVLVALHGLNVSTEARL